MSAPPATTRPSSASARFGARPKPTMPTPQHRRRDAHRGAVAVDARRPAARHRREQRRRPPARRRAARARPAPPRWLGDGREERHRHAEEHRDDVDDVGAHQLRARAGVAQPLDDRARRLGGSASGGGGTARIIAQRRERDREGGRVDGVGRRHAGGRDQHAADRRAGDHADRHPKRARAPPAAISSSRSTSRGVSASSDGRCRPSSVASSADITNSTHSCGCGEQRVCDQHERRRRERELGQLHQPPPVEGVGERAADERGRQERHQLGQPEQPDDERRAAQLVGLVGDRDVGDHRAEERHPLADEEQPEVAPPPQRPDVDRRQPQQPARAARRDRRARGRRARTRPRARPGEARSSRAGGRAARRTGRRRRSRPRRPRRCARRVHAPGPPAGRRRRTRRSARSRASCGRTGTPSPPGSRRRRRARPRRPGARFTAKVSSPGMSACWPSAIVRGVSIRTRSPAASERRVSSPAARLDADHADAGRERLGGRRAAGDQPAAADGCEQQVESGHLLEQLERGRALPGHHRRMLVRRHERRGRARRPGPRRAPRGPRCSGRR